MKLICFSKNYYNKEGSGLGLSICKNIADMLNHELNVSSELGDRTEFSIILDCQFPHIGKKFFNYFTKNDNFSQMNCDNRENNVSKSARNKRPNNFYDKEENIIKSSIFNTNNREISDLPEISVCSHSSCQTQIIKDQNFYLDKEKLNRSSPYFNIYRLENSSNFDNDLINFSSQNSNNLPQIFLNNLLNVNSSSSLSNSKKINIQSNRDKFLLEKTNNTISDIKSENFYLKNYNDFQRDDKKLNNSALIKPNLNNDKSTISFENNTVYDIKEDYIFKKKILIVDDHTIIRNSMVFLVMKCIKLLNKENEFEIIEGKDGLDILNNIIDDQYKNNLIKCVFTDENMEYLNGSEAIQILKNLEKNKKIKNVVICSTTAFQDELSISRISSSGANEILGKPCTEKMIKDFLFKYKIF